ncbi:MAG: hypothetical protein JWM95_1292 [Gemmatimonadetes bacterium]|nr:hypothetical protein [Gemmatimonadota bacterium]
MTMRTTTGGAMKALSIALVLTVAGAIGRTNTSSAPASRARSVLILRHTMTTLMHDVP